MRPWRTPSANINPRPPDKPFLQLQQTCPLMGAPANRQAFPTATADLSPYGGLLMGHWGLPQRTCPLMGDSYGGLSAQILGLHRAHSGTAPGAGYSPPFSRPTRL